MESRSKSEDQGVDVSLAEFTETILNDSIVQVTPIVRSDETKGRVQTPLEKGDFVVPTAESTQEKELRSTPSYEKRKNRETNQYQVSKEILSETVDEETQLISVEVQKAMEEKYKVEQEAIQLRLQQEKLQREQEDLARKQAEELLVKEQQCRIELEKGKALLEEQQRKTQELKDRLTPENIENREKIERDLQKARIREQDVQQEFRKQLVSAESIQALEGTVRKLTEDEMRKIQLRKVKLEAKLRKLISAHSLVVASCELNPMLEGKYQILKQNMYNDIVTCEVMLEPIASPVSDTSSKIEKVEIPHELQTIPIMDPTEKEFRERLGSMERDEEVPSYIKPETVGKREVYYLTLKRQRIISDIELLNHMYGAVQAIGNLDIDIIDRYQAVKRKATKTIQKCNELLNATGKGIENGSEKSSESPWKIIPNKTQRRDNTLIRPDIGERGREREELLRTVKKITK